MALKFIPSFSATEDFTWGQLNGTTETFNDGSIVGRANSALEGVFRPDQAYLSWDYPVSSGMMLTGIGS